MACSRVAGCRLAGVGRAAGQQSGSSLVAERVFFDRAVGWSGVRAGALFLLLALRGCLFCGAWFLIQILLSVSLHC